MRWLICYKHTFGCDVFEGSYEEAEAFGIQSVKEELEEDGIPLPIIINNCGVKEECKTYKDFIEEICEYEDEE